ncbi:uncharacterized protein RAG0_16597 [Rhynchosporium agropyri]|uniref:DUF7726 domain-containing protein n=1 Tax=Rhynchosporium agropyri TaxID=914238 RepID=A0A1E1LR55_9HELO|nr:uncharacterized protein RAG0_16597 [Rhynchosporium agropyri]
MAAANAWENASTENPLSLKRTAEHSEHDDEESDEESDEEIYITHNCDQIRRKIHAFINSGEMKVGEFQKAIVVEQAARTKAVGVTHMYKHSDTFYQREAEGKKIAPRKKTTKTATAEADARGSPDDITLEGEAECAVPIFDTSDEIRKKIRAYLAASSGTQADFPREIAKPYHDGRKIQSKVLK